MRVCVYCGSRPGNDAVFAEGARALGAGLAQRGLDLVYGGGNVGLMAVVADAVLDGGGTAIGIMPRHLAELEIVHDRLTETVITRDMHERKAEMHRRADAYVALPGGYGTIEEFAEVLSWRQIGLLAKPIAFLNTTGVYDGLIAFLRKLGGAGFLTPASIDELIVESEVDRLLDRLAAAR